MENPDNDVAVVVFDSANADFFSAHVDMTQVPALGELEQVTIASMPLRAGGGAAGIAVSSRRSSSAG